MSIATVKDVKDSPAVLTIAQVQALLGLSRPKAYEPANRSGFPVIRFGRALRMPKLALLQWLADQMDNPE
jgi:excisionase family DNA binding protein